MKEKLHHNWSNPGKEQTHIDSNGDINVARWNQLVSELEKASLTKHPFGMSDLGMIGAPLDTVSLFASTPDKTRRSH